MLRAIFISLLVFKLERVVATLSQTRVLVLGRSNGVTRIALSDRAVYSHFQKSCEVTCEVTGN